MLDPALYRQYRDAAAYEAAAEARRTAWLLHTAHEQQLADDIQAGRAVTIACPVCGDHRRLRFAPPINWREDGVCDGCATNARMRFSLHLMQAMLEGCADARVYLTEQLSGTYAAMHRRFPRIAGSEFMPDASTRRRRQRDLDRLLGRRGWRPRTDGGRLRHEDVTRLGFPSGEFDLVGCFDVLEHVPDYRRAARELGRVLKPGAALVLTAPFVESASTTRVRARVDDTGRIEHLCTPEYHTSSTAGERHLCYYHFGWDLLDTLRDEGFADVSLVTCWSGELGIFGAMNAVVARTATP